MFALGVPRRRRGARAAAEGARQAGRLGLRDGLRGAWSAAWSARGSTTCVQNYDELSSDDLLGNIFGGAGLVWYGGAIGGAIGVLLWAWRRGFLGLALLDLCAVPLALGYAIGRIGCQLSGDGDYGKAVGRAVGDGLSQGHRADDRDRPPDADLRDPRDGPARLGAVAAARPRAARACCSPCYLVGAGAERFLVEFLRRNPESWPA